MARGRNRFRIGPSSAKIRLTKGYRRFLNGLPFATAEWISFLNLSAFLRKGQKLDGLTRLFLSPH
jgi:hypothetical protein